MLEAIKEFLEIRRKENELYEKRLQELLNWRENE
jgi:hypothetical protein